MSHIVTTQALPSDTKLIRRYFALNSVYKLIQRYFTQLDLVANAYYELASPITLTGDFDIGIKLLTTDDTNQVILGDSHTDNLYMNMGSGSITLWLNGQHRAFNAVSKNLTDGKQHDILFQMRANTLECIIDSESLGTLNVTNPVITSANLRIGASNSVLIYFDGILSDLIITDKSGAEDVTTTFALDKPPASALYEYGDELVVNGNFDVNVDGWTGIRNGTHEFDNGRVKIVNGSNGYHGVYRTLTLEIGKHYEVSTDYSHVDGSAFVMVSSTNNLTNDRQIPTVVKTSSTRLNVIFTATIDNAFIGVAQGSTETEGNIAYFDNISVREITNYTEVQATKNIEYSKENTFGSELSQVSLYEVIAGLSTLVDDTTIHLLTDVGGAYTSINAFPSLDTNTYVLTADVDVRAGSLLVTNASENITHYGGVSSKIEVLIPSGGLRIKRGAGGVLNDIMLSNVSIREIQGNALTRINVDDEDIGLYTKTDDGWLAKTNNWVDSDAEVFAGTEDSILDNVNGIYYLKTTGGITGVQCSTQPMQADHLYEISYTVLGQGTGILGLSDFLVDIPIDEGTHKILLTAPSTRNIYFKRIVALDVTISNVSVKHLIQVAEQIVPVLPSITAQPQAVTEDEGTAWSITSSAVDDTSSQWYKNGVATGITTDTLTGTGLVSESGSYFNRYTNSDGSTDTATVTVTINEVAQTSGFNTWQSFNSWG